MIRYLLDTNVLSEPIRQQPDSQLLSRLKEHGVESATCSSVWHELWYGCLRLPTSRKRRVLENYLSGLGASQLLILSYDDESARMHAELREEMQSRGLVPSQSDGEIAAVAKFHGLILVTRNVRHFDGFPGLLVENWFSQEPKVTDAPR